ncbi:MAG TPA: DUF58 domain-containing protein [Anaerolineales bacterium]
MSSGQTIVLVLLALSIIAGAVTGSQLYFRLSYLWGLLFASSWIWALLSLRGVRFARRARTFRAQVGQIFEERFELDNPNRLPRLWISVRDESPLPGSQGSRVFPMIEARRGRTYVVRTRLIQRGVFPLGPTVLESGDPFGLVPVRREILPEESLLVYPMMVDVRAFPSPPGIMPGGEALRRRTAQVTANAAGVREYEPGDSMSRIHWVSTARRGRLMSKEFELDPLAEVWIFLDASESTKAALPYELSATDAEALWRRTARISIPPDTEEYGVSIAASLARYYLRHGRSVGFVSVGQAMSVLAPERGGRQLSKILEALALLRAEGDLPLRALVEIQAQHMTRGSTVVLITAATHRDIALTADYLLRRGLRPIVLLIDAASFNGPAGTEELVSMMKFMRVTVIQIKQGDNLESALSREWSL